MYIDSTVYQARPPQPRTPVEEAVYDRLEQLGISYTRVDHDHADTMEDCLLIENTLGARICKNLFLCNRSGTKFYLLLICADKPFRTGDVSRQLGSSRLSFCSDAQLMDKLGLVAGSVTPMALYRESARDVVVAIDEDIFDMNMCACIRAWPRRRSQ